MSMPVGHRDHGDHHGQDGGGGHGQHDGHGGHHEPRHQGEVRHREGSTLSSRLEALSELVELGGGVVEPRLVEEARSLLTRAQRRLGMSAEHTVIALAGATGSGKSSLFNVIAGIELSPVGVRRPTTGAAHACVWGLEGSRELLEWLSVEKRHRYARATALDTDAGSSLDGLILLDLPDHDSTAQPHRLEVDRLVGVADLVVWVVDPQKYGDAAVHQRYLQPFATHQSVIAVVLNQVDVLSDGQLEECVEDLRQLLVADGLTEPRLLATSVRSGAGMAELRDLIDETLGRRRALADRLAADLDAVAEGFGQHGPGESVQFDTGDRAAINAQLHEAAGVPAVTRAMSHEHVQQGLRYVQWPFLRLVGGFADNPVRRLRLGAGAWEELRAGPVGAVPAQAAMVDNLLLNVTDALTPQPPEPWLSVIGHAAQSRAGEIPEAVGEEVASVASERGPVPGWWRLAAGAQWTLAATAVLALVWSGASLAFGFATALLPYAVLAFAVALLVGAAGGWLGQRGLVRAADVRQRAAESRMTERVEDVAERLIFAPMREELQRYARFVSAVRRVAGADEQDGHDRQPAD